MCELLNLKDLIIVGFMFEIGSALFLASDILQPKQKILAESKKESRTTFGFNPFYVKKTIENFYRAKLGLFLLAIGFSLQFLDFIFSTDNKSPHWVQILFIAIISLLTGIYLARKLLRKLTFNTLVDTLGKSDLEQLSKFINSNKWGEEASNHYQGLYGDYVKRKPKESDLDYFKNLKRALEVRLS